MPINVLVADDHQLVRQGLRALLEREGFRVVGEAANGQDALQLAGTLHPEVAVLDLAMPLLNGIDTAREIQRISPKTKTILLTMHTDRRYILEALRGGAKGYVMKTHAADDLVRAIREAARGGTYLSPEISEAVVLAYQDKTEIPPDPLSARERQVLQLIAEGKTTKEVAVTLDISVKTAETYRTRIMEKLDLHETASLVRYAIRRGLVQP
jgi:two-component system, NarL family, response regulator NreC